MAVPFRNPAQVGHDAEIDWSLWSQSILPWPQMIETRGGYLSLVETGKSVGYPAGWAEKLNFMDNTVKNNPYPYSYFAGGILAPSTTQQQSRLTAILPDLNTYIQELCSALVMGEKSLDDVSWNRYIADMKRMGLDEVISIWQARINKASGK
jgi:hypothetical protein